MSQHCNKTLLYIEARVILWRMANKPPYMGRFELLLDSDVEKVLDFMSVNIKNAKLLFVARTIAQVAELAWANAVPDARPFTAVEMRRELILEASDAERRSNAIQAPQT